MDREKVISEFDDFVKSFSKRDDTYYKGLFASVLVLLKEQQNQIWEMQDREEYLEDKLKEQPQIVRCKDCVFGKREKNDSTWMTWIYCGHHSENRPEDWFCASGSRIPLQEGR